MKLLTVNTSLVQHEENALSGEHGFVVMQFAQSVYPKVIAFKSPSILYVVSKLNLIWVQPV